MRKITFLLLALVLAAGPAMAGWQPKELKTPDNYRVSVEPVQVKMAYDAAGNIEYVGRAVPGAATSAEVWQIQKFSYTDGILTGISFADNGMSFSKSWDSREAYSYE